MIVHGTYSSIIILTKLLLLPTGYELHTPSQKTNMRDTLRYGRLQANTSNGHFGMCGWSYTLQQMNKSLTHAWRKNVVTAQFLPGILDVNLCKNKQTYN